MKDEIVTRDFVFKIEGINKKESFVEITYKDSFIEELQNYPIFLNVGDTLTFKVPMILVKEKIVPCKSKSKKKK